MLKSGGRWIDAPETYGPRKTLYNRFVRWAVMSTAEQTRPRGGVKAGQLGCRPLATRALNGVVASGRPFGSD